MTLQPDPHTPGAENTNEVLAFRGSAGTVLGLCDEFFLDHASPAVHDELRRFLTDLGHHPVAGLGAFLHELSSAALNADTGRPRRHETRRTAELTRLLADASVLPAGAHTRDVGAYRALEFMVRSAAHYWATADVVGNEGSGHLEVTVARARASTWSPPTLVELQEQPGLTGTERHQPDGSVVTTCTTTWADGGVATRAILARPDGTYIEVMAHGDDSRTSGGTRSTAVIDAGTVLDKITDLRP